MFIILYNVSDGVMDFAFLISQFELLKHIRAETRLRIIACYRYMWITLGSRGAAGQPDRSSFRWCGNPNQENSLYKMLPGLGHLQYRLLLSTFSLYFFLFLICICYLFKDTCKERWVPINHCLHYCYSGQYYQGNDILVCAWRLIGFKM